MARGLAALALVATAKAQAAAHSGDACFGGVAETAAAGVFSAGNLTVIGQSLYATGRGLQRVNLRTGQVSSVAEVFRRVLEVGPIDAREAYARTTDNDIVAYDFASGRTRRLALGRLGSESMYPMNDPPFALDGRYFYYGQFGGPFRERQDSGIFRVRRDGSGRPEALGVPPASGARSDVLIDGGFFYYRGAARDGAAAIVRRHVEAGSPEQELVVLQHPSSRLMRIFDGRLYYVDDRALWSVSVRGGAPPTRLVSAGEIDPIDVLFEPGCLYWADGRKIRRVELGRAGVQPETIADEATYQEAQLFEVERWRPGTLASDGRYLYWPDAGGNRIMRAGRDPRPLPPRPALVGAWIGGTARTTASVNLGAVVPVQLDRPPLNRAVVLDVPAQQGSPWEPSCKIHFGCDQATPALSACPRAAASSAERWAALLAKAPSLVGTKVNVRGPLALGWIPRGPGMRVVASHSGAAIGQPCAPGQCCNKTPRPIVIGGAEDPLGLESFQCVGDDSRVCCNAPALGQLVIASGILERTGRGGWRLTSPEICALPREK